MGAQCGVMLQHSRGTDRQRRGAGAAAHSGLSADRYFLGAREERAQWLQCRNPVSWVKILSGSKDPLNKDTAGRERMTDRLFLYPFCLNLLTWGLLCVNKMIILVYSALKSGLWAQKPFQCCPGSSLCWEGLCLFRLGGLYLKGLASHRSQHTSHIPLYFPTINKTHSRGYIIFPGFFFFLIMGKKHNSFLRADIDGSTESFVLSPYLHKASH